MATQLQLILCVFSAVYLNSGVEGHGYMLNPINRASLWRIDSTQPTNFNDNEYFCGGTRVQYVINEGKCGPCGDDWRDSVPRSNENSGIYGNGVIVANYTAGEVIEVTTLITANHLGSLYFQLCELKDPSQPESEECFKSLKLEDGTGQHPVLPQDQKVSTKVKLPDDFTCERCVLRWHYRTGNSWGRCEDGTQNVGCGNQEIFRSCADIKINPKKTPGDDPPEDPSDDPAEDPSEEVPPENPNHCDPPTKEIPNVPLLPADPFKLTATGIKPSV